MAKYIFLSSFIASLETILRKRPKINNHDKLEVIIKSLHHKLRTRGDIEFDEEQMAASIGLKNYKPENNQPYQRPDGPKQVDPNKHLYD